MQNGNNLSKVLDELNFTIDSSSSMQTFPTVSLNKIDSEVSKEELLFNFES